MMISLSMIVRDEEELIGSCLSSVKDFVDEIVIVDTGSKDSTITLAEAAGAKVHHMDWPGDFAPARNYALNLVHGDWVLVLDADEQLNSECIPVLKSLIALEDVLVINLLRYEVGAAMAPYSMVSRLFRNHPRISWNRPYHSIIDDSVSSIIAKEPTWRLVDCLSPALIHDGYREEVIKTKKKSKKLRESMEQWLSLNPGDPYACAKLGALEVEEGSIEKGLNLLQEGLQKLQHSSQKNVMEEYELLFCMGIALSTIDPDKAIYSYQRAIKLPLDDRVIIGARLNLAGLYMKLGDLDKAINLTEMVTNSAPEVLLGWFNLGLLKRKIGDIDSALSAYINAEKINPMHPETCQNLALLRFGLGDINAARQGLRKAIDLFITQGRKDKANTLVNDLAGIINLGD